MLSVYQTLQLAVRAGFQWQTCTHHLRRSMWTVRMHTHGSAAAALQELAAMAAEARQEPAEAPPAGCYETTSRAELPAHDLAGIR